MLKGEGAEPLRLPHECCRQLSLTWWLVGFANWEGCVRGKVSCPARGLMLASSWPLSSVMFFFFFFLVWWQEFQRERWSYGKLLGSKMTLQDKPGEARAGTGLRVSGHSLWRRCASCYLCLCTFSVVLVNLSSWAAITSLLVYSLICITCSANPLPTAHRPAASWWLRLPGHHFQHWGNGFSSLPCPSPLPFHFDGLVHTNMIYLRWKLHSTAHLLAPLVSKVNYLCLNLPLLVRARRTSTGQPGRTIKQILPHSTFS